MQIDDIFSKVKTPSSKAFKFIVWDDTRKRLPFEVEDLEGMQVSEAITWCILGYTLEIFCWSEKESKFKYQGQVHPPVL